MLNSVLLPKLSSVSRAPALPVTCIFCGPLIGIPVSIPLKLALCKAISIGTPVLLAYSSAISYSVAAAPVSFPGKGVIV